MTTAFISYAHKDRAIAYEIAFGLERRGCRVWIDQGELSVGDSLVERLAEAIHEVDFVVALVSPHSVESSWCRRELSLAMTHEIDLEGRFGVRRVLPLRLGEVRMPPLLRDKLYLSVAYDSPGSIVPKLWEDMGGQVASSPGEEPSSLPADGAEVAYRRGRNLYDKGEIAAARRHLHDAAQDNHREAALLLGEILYDQGEVEKAAREWEFAATSENPNVANPAVIQYGRMLAHVETSRSSLLGTTRGSLIGGHAVEEADRMWREAAESGHRDAAWAWLGLGLLWEDRPEPDVESNPVKAEDAFERATRSGHSESHAYAIHKLGRVKWRLGRIDDAIAVLGVVAGGSDREWAPVCSFDLGRIYWDREDEREAEFWWYQAAEADHPISDAAREALEDPSSIWRLR
ncbi:MAG: hypothetical protein QOE75_632 [Solirubrobacterales bacterium]|nr:hypothetical protein [Solirubrobacterales bacterium]